MHTAFFRHAVFRRKCNPYFWAVINFGLVHQKFESSGLSTPRKEPIGVMKCSPFFWTGQLTFSRKMINQNLNKASQIPRYIKTLLCDKRTAHERLCSCVPSGRIFIDNITSAVDVSEEIVGFFGKFNGDNFSKWNTNHYWKSSNTKSKKYSYSKQQLLFNNTPLNY